MADEAALHPDVSETAGAIVTERGQFPPESVVVPMRELCGEAPRGPWGP